jgi:hypothetical protein
MPFTEYEGEAQPGWTWDDHTRWTKATDEIGKPEVLLRQVGPNTFQLAGGFRYTMYKKPNVHWDVPRHDPTGRFDQGDNNSTDLASVPSWLWWFIASYGRHSRAALLHDHLIDLDEVTDKDADLAFRNALLESKVPFLRRWLMWGAVSMRTMWASAWWWKLAVLALAVHVVAFAAALVYAISSSWEALDGVLAWPFVHLVWSPLEWLWGLAVVNRLVDFLWWVPGHLWSVLDRLLPGTAWWEVVSIGVAGLLFWRKRWLITLTGIALVALPTLAIFAARAVYYALEEVLKIGSKLPGVPTQEVDPSFGDPFRVQGGPM